MLQKHYPSFSCTFPIYPTGICAGLGRGISLSPGSGLHGGGWEGCLPGHVSSGVYQEETSGSNFGSGAHAFLRACCMAASVAKAAAGVAAGGSRRQARCAGSQPPAWQSEKQKRQLLPAFPWHTKISAAKKSQSTASRCGGNGNENETDGGEKREWRHGI